MQLKKAISVVLVVFVTSSGCRSSDSTGPAEAATRGIGATVLLYSQTGSNAIIEAEMLLDGKHIGSRQRIETGADTYWLTFEQALTSAGSHRVGVRIIAQRYPIVDYLIGGSAYGVNAKTQSSVQVAFPSTTRPLRVGDIVEVSVVVP